MPAAAAEHFATAFGHAWRADISLGQFNPATSAEIAGLPTVVVREIAKLAVRVPLRSINGGEVFTDGLRLSWRQEATFDMFDGERIEYLPGQHWRGSLPLAFFSTTTALTLAWRGLIPLHATAVEIGGRAVLIAGPPAAGKSTLAAGLIDRGARLISDDLSVISSAADGGRIFVHRGRPSMRLHPDTAMRVAADYREQVPDDPRSKLLVRPHARIEDGSIPLGHFVVLGQKPGLIDAAIAPPLLLGQLFRPRWLAALPGHVARLGAMISVAGTVPVIGFNAIEGVGLNEQDDRAAALLGLLSANDPLATTGDIRRP